MQWPKFSPIARLRLTGGDLSFKKACALSLLLHAVLLAAAGLMVNVFYVPNLHRPPLVFDFVFIPTEEVEERSQRDLAPEEQPADLPKPQAAQQTDGRHTTSQARTDEAQTKIRTLEDEATEMASSSETIHAPTDDAQRTEGADNPDLPEDWTDPGDMPEERTVANIQDLLDLSPIEATNLKLPDFKHRNRDRLTPKISMAKKQRKRLLKELNKLAEKLPEMSFADTVLVWNIKDQAYRVRVRHQPVRTETDLENVTVQVHTVRDGKALVTEVKMKRLAFSSFAQFVDYWSPYVAIHDDRLVGRFHSNTSFVVSNDWGVKPQFHGKVTTAGYRIKKGGQFPFFDYDSMFLGGLETGTRVIHMPKGVLPFTEEATMDSSRLHVVSEETWIRFHRDGRYAWRTKSQPERVYHQELPDEASFIIVGRNKATIHLKGVVNGKVLVYTHGKIIIDDNLVYARHPEVVAFADDYLGLISEDNVEIAHPSITGEGDLYIHASIFARDEFRVRNLYGHGEAMLYIYGSVSAGSISATEPRYATHVQFDKRLAYRRPPHFPMTDRYEITDWDGYWRLNNP